MESRFTSEFFTGNRQRLRELFTGTAPIVVTANGLLQRGADSAFGFAQDANFWYLTGIDEPDIVLVMDRDKEYLIVPGRNAIRQAFDGVVATEPLIQRSGIQTVYDEEAGWEQLLGRLKKVKHAATLALPLAYVEHYGLYTNPARAMLVQRLKSAKPDLELLDLSLHLSRLRMIKQSPELAAIQKAIDITVAAMKESFRPAKMRGYAFEYQLEAELSRGFRRRGASGHAFEPVVASGARACVLHNVANDGALAADELIVVDVGAEIEHYAADITRTASLGQLSRRQESVHAAVLEVQRFAFGLLRPGVLMKDYEQQVEHFMGEKLRELGLIKTISHENVRQFFPHATSHFLGLNVHDIGDYERPLEAGVVLTVEPGIYIPDEGIGVRIEDDVLITPRGIKILSDKLSRTLT
ncbi:MAG TPA: aminopeptidase P N-terminal domain-containing protein [Verrucomicrobiae bacterium]|jgi:Xaa-Pro aminopeptidase|nr:aminopeptidase P N-terminal domain-containing protein [Verrucomicrobiae bacterium]